MNPKPVREARGGSAEWCPRCSLMVLVVKTGQQLKAAWRCPTCYGLTVPNA